MSIQQPNYDRPPKRISAGTWILICIFLICPGSCIFSGILSLFAAHNAHQSPEDTPLQTSDYQATPIPVASGQSEESPVKPLKLKDVSMRVTEANDIWWKYAWKLTVKNNESHPIFFDVEIEFLDNENFVVDTDDEYSLMLEGGEENTFTGYDLITMPAASNVTAINAKARLK